MLLKNLVILEGNLSQDHTAGTTKGGTKYLKNSIAVNEKFGDKERVGFFRFTAWNHSANYIEKYASKGSQVRIIGQLVQNTYDDKEGKRQSSVEIVVQEVTILNGKNSGTNEGASTKSPKQESQSKPKQQKVKEESDDTVFDSILSIGEDDLPF